MKHNEFSHIFAAILLFTAISGLYFVIRGEFEKLAIAFVFSAIIIFVNVLAKKVTAGLVDADVEHELWFMQRYGIKAHKYLKSKVPTGIIFPLVLSVFSLGFIKAPTFLIYEARALKRRASKRFGFYSFTEMTEFHHGLIGAGGIVALLILAIISYTLPYAELEYLAKLSLYYAFFNMLPISKLDGTQIFFASRILWTTLAIITTILTAFALIIP